MTNIYPTENVQSKRVTSTILFNAVNGKFLNVIDIPLEIYKRHQGSISDLVIAIEREFDFVTDTVVGDLIIDNDGNYTENFEVVRLDETKPIRTEESLNMTVEYKITTKYPIIEQVNILSRAVQKLATEAKVDLPELKEMVSFIELCLETNENQKEFFRTSDDYIYISNEQQRAEASERMEGGLHEAVGARNITGGRIFKTDSN